MYQGVAAETGMLSNPAGCFFRYNSAELTGNGMWYIEMYEPEGKSIKSVKPETVHIFG